MKKYLVSFICGFSFFLLGNLGSGVPAQADTISSLSDEAKQHFINERFSDADEVSTETTYQQGNLRAINMVTIAAATKRVSSTMGYTSYYITSGKPILTTATVVVYYGGYSKSSSVNVYGRPGSYSGGIYFSYSGKSQYFGCRVTSQVTTTMGPTSVSSRAGGLTLGK